MKNDQNKQLKKRMEYFETFCKMMQDDLYVYLSEFSKDKEVIEEIFQEIFSQVYIHIDELMKISLEDQRVFVLVYAKSCIYQHFAGIL